MATNTVPVSVTGSEFTVPDAASYNRQTPFRWVVSHLMHLKGWVVLFLVTSFLT